MAFVLGVNTLLRLNMYKFNAYITIVMFQEYVICIYIRCGKRRTLSDYITGDHRNMDVVSTLSEQKFGIACRGEFPKQP